MHVTLKAGVKFNNGWRDASSFWLLRKTCFRGGISLPAQISCLRGRHFEGESKNICPVVLIRTFCN